MNQEVFLWRAASGVTIENFIGEKLIDGWKLQNIHTTEIVKGKSVTAVLSFFKIEESGDSNVTIKLF